MIFSHKFTKTLKYLFPMSRKPRDKNSHFSTKPSYPTATRWNAHNQFLSNWKVNELLTSYLHKVKHFYPYCSQLRICAIVKVFYFSLQWKKTLSWRKCVINFFKRKKYFQPCKVLEKRYLCGQRRTSNWLTIFLQFQSKSKCICDEKYPWNYPMNKCTVQVSKSEHESTIMLWWCLRSVHTLNIVAVRTSVGCCIHAVQHKRNPEA